MVRKTNMKKTILLLTALASLTIANFAYADVAGDAGRTGCLIGRAILAGKDFRNWKRLDGIFYDLAEDYGYKGEELGDFVNIATTVYVGDDPHLDVKCYEAARRDRYTTNDDLRNFAHIATEVIATTVKNNGHDKYLESTPELPSFLNKEQHELNELWTSMQKKLGIKKRDPMEAEKSMIPPAPLTPRPKRPATGVVA
jgi:hypothetical protein